MWAFEALVKNLNRRHEARLKLQRAFRWRCLQQAIYNEVMRRIERNREIQRKLLESVAAEQSEVNQLRLANERMLQSLNEKDEHIKRLEASKREENLAGVD